MRIALIVSQYHAFVTDGLERGARELLAEQGVSAVERLAVPGAFELAQAASRAAHSGRFEAVICLGCLIRGETPHFDYIASACAHGITAAAGATGVPMSFGVLTTNSVEEALERAGADEGNKGREAAQAALEMARLFASLGDHRS